MSLPVETTAADTGSARFIGRRRVYWRILTRGAVLLMVTLGIYRFWLTTDVRRFLWSNTEIDGDGLEYTGTPLELLTGFLVAIIILIPIYIGFFIAAFDLGLIGRSSGIAAFAAIGVLGQFAIYRARRYRLSRTVLRGLRFHQEGSAWRYTARASGWWILTAITLGLAYPFQLASLERFKMKYTFYGELGGQFTGAGARLFVRGLPLWFLVLALVIAAIYTIYETIDGMVLIGLLYGGGSIAAIVVALLIVALPVAAAALCYPAFQTIVLRWWLSGLRFGPITVQSTLRMRQVYGAYGLFVLYAILFGLVVLLIAAPVLWFAVNLDDSASLGAEAGAAFMLLTVYVFGALGLSTIYRATVMLSLWQLGIESLQLSGLSARDDVTAKGRASSPFGEGLADALNVGGY